MKQVTPHIIFSIVWFAFCSLGLCNEIIAQDMGATYTYTPINYTQEQIEINAKRIGVELDGKDALASAREFIRIDPKYYVGHLYEGAAKYNIAVDYIGFNSALVPLRKAAELLKNNYGKLLKKRTNNPLQLYTYYQLHRDADYLYEAINTCFSNIEQPDSAVLYLREFQQYDLQDEQYCETFNGLAWLVHRNRFYTNKKYAFLKENLVENEKYAQQLLDSGIAKIYRDQKLTEGIFGDITTMKLQSVNHYRSLLYSYNLQIDSAQKYYDLLKTSGFFPANNYATYCMIQAKFKDADENYTKASEREYENKSLREYVYYQTVINAYQNQPKKSIQYLKEFIPQNGINPGYGWYNLAMARSLLYDGQFNIAEKYLSKAENFKELHIGTTLGESHYQLSIGVLKLLAKEQQIKAIKFQDKKWWYKPSKIGKWMGLLVQKYTIQYLLINQLAANPERDNVLYKILSTESTISFDEVWLLIKDFSPGFFIKKFDKEINATNRPLVRKYFQLFLAKLYLARGDKIKAQQTLDTMESTAVIDPVYEKLFQFRVTELQLALTKDADEQRKLSNTLFTYYPQLTPFTNAKVDFIVHFTGGDKDGKDILKGLAKANINIVPEGTSNAQHLFIQMLQQGKYQLLSYHLINKDGLMITSPKKIIYTGEKSVVPHLKYALFGVGYFEGSLF